MMSRNKFIGNNKNLDFFIEKFYIFLEFRLFGIYVLRAVELLFWCWCENVGELRMFSFNYLHTCFVRVSVILICSSHTCSVRVSAFGKSAIVWAITTVDRAKTAVGFVFTAVEFTNTGAECKNIPIDCTNTTAECKNTAVDYINSSPDLEKTPFNRLETIIGCKKTFAAYIFTGEI